MDVSAVQSDHSLIIFNFEDTKEIVPQNIKTRYNDENIDKVKLQSAALKCLEKQERNRSLNAEAIAKTNAIKEACEKVLPKSSRNKVYRPP